MTLTMLAHILMRSKPPPGAPNYPSLLLLAKHIMTASATMNDAAAIICLASLSFSNSGIYIFTNVERNKYMERLDELAKDGTAEAMILLAQKHTRDGAIERAIRYWDSAANAGSGYACSELGKLQVRTGNKEQAKEAFRMGVELGNVQYKT